MKSKLLFTLILTGIVFTTCDKKPVTPEVPEEVPKVPDKDFVYAGILDSLTCISIFDTVCTSQNNSIYHEIDINNDSINDFKFYESVSSSQGNSSMSFYFDVTPINNTEIQIDPFYEMAQYTDTINYNGYPNVYYSNYVTINEPTPKKIKFGDKIFNQGIWQKGISLILAYYSFDSPEEYDTFYIRHSAKYEGWSVIENEFLGFRLLSETDTIYGWLGLEVPNIDHMIIKEAAYR